MIVACNNVSVSDPINAGDTAVSNHDKRTSEEFGAALLSARWTAGFRERNSQGLLVTFQDRQDTCDVPGIEKRHIQREDGDDAGPKFLAERKVQ